MKDKISGSKIGETSLKEFLRKNLTIFETSGIRVFEAIAERREEKRLTFGYFISCYSRSFEEQTNYLGNIREFTFF